MTLSDLEELGWGGLSPPPKLNKLYISRSPEDNYLKKLILPITVFDPSIRFSPTYIISETQQ